MSQTYRDWELIIVDDGSTDNSLGVVRDKVRELESDSNNRSNACEKRIRVIHKENRGVCSARNRGIQEAKGDYIAFLDADDLWDKDYLAEQVKMIHDFPEAAMWGINFAEINNGKLVRKLETGLPDGYRGYVENYFQMPGRISDLFCSSSVVIRRDVFDQVGTFDERLKYSEDNDMWWRIIASYPAAFYDRYMVFYRYDAENRALKRKRPLKYFMPYYIGKYRETFYQYNTTFYHYVNRWAAQEIRSYYFSKDKINRIDAQKAVKDIDYSVIPYKYRLLYKWPYMIAFFFNELDNLYHRL